MNQDERQAALLEAYVHALQTDIDAIPPRELEAEIAMFARKLVRTQGQKPLPSATKAQMWRQIQHAASDYLQDKENQDMNQPIPYLPRKQESFPFAWVAVMIILVLISISALMIVNRSPEDDFNPIGLSLQQDETEDVPQVTPTTIPMVTRVPTESLGIVTLPNNQNYIPVVTTIVTIPAGGQITPDMLTIVYWPEEHSPSPVVGMFEHVVGLYARQDIPAFAPILMYPLRANEEFEPTVDPLFATATGFVVEQTVSATMLTSVANPVTATPVAMGQSPTLDPIFATATGFILQATHEVFALTATAAPMATRTPLAAPIRFLGVTEAGDLSREAITIINDSLVTIDISDWELRVGDAVYPFPQEAVVIGGAGVMVITRSGEDTPFQFYWGLDEAIYGSQVAISLVDGSGQVQAFYVTP